MAPEGRRQLASAVSEAGAGRSSDRSSEVDDAGPCICGATLHGPPGEAGPGWWKSFDARLRRPFKRAKNGMVTPRPSTPNS